MFYDEIQAMNACKEEPTLIFDLIKEGYMEVVDKILSKKIVSVNTCDENENDVLSRLLKNKNYALVLKHMKDKTWNVNHQNKDGDTFAHILVSIHYVSVLDIIKKLKKNKSFIPNIKNNKGESILDKSINDNYIYTTVKILEDTRFNNIDIASFKKIYDTYVKSDHYGKYTKLTNLEIILGSLEEKSLVPRMEQLLQMIQQNFEIIKSELLDNHCSQMDSIINSMLIEGMA